MIMEDPFESAKLLLQEAEENISTFDTLAGAFVHHDNWTSRVDVDPQTGEKICKIIFKAMGWTPPDGIGVPKWRC